MKIKGIEKMNRYFVDHVAGGDINSSCGIRNASKGPRKET